MDDGPFPVLYLQFTPDIVYPFFHVRQAIGEWPCMGRVEACAIIMYGDL